MNINEHSFVDYRRAIAANREIFLLKFPNVFLDFLTTDDYCSALAVAISKGRTKEDKTLISFLPFMGLIQRQMRNAFEAFATAHSYQGWVLLRPALEAALIMGKWTDDRDSAEIWKNRDADWKSYQKAYSGKALLSQSLPESEGIRSVLSRVNDDFMHFNPTYYFRHSRLNAVDPQNYLYTISYFDDNAEQEFHVHAFMHLCVLVARSVASLLQKQYAKPMGIDVNLNGFRKSYGKTVQRLAKQTPEGIPILTELGLWPNNTFHGTQ